MVDETTPKMSKIYLCEDEIEKLVNLSNNERDLTTENDSDFQKENTVLNDCMYKSGKGFVKISFYKITSAKEITLVYGLGISAFSELKNFIHFISYIIFFILKHNFI